MNEDADRLAILFGVTTKVFMLVHHGILDRSLNFKPGQDLTTANMVLMQTCKTKYPSMGSLSEDINYARAACNVLY